MFLADSWRRSVTGWCMGGAASGLKAWTKRADTAVICDPMSLMFISMACSMIGLRGWVSGEARWSLRVVGSCFTLRAGMGLGKGF